MTDLRPDAPVCIDVEAMDSYAWLEQISQMNRQLFMVTNTNLYVEFISQYTLDFLDREFGLTDIPSPLPYKLVIRHLAQNGCFGDGNVEDIIEAQTVMDDGRLLLIGNDISEEHIEEHALKLALDSSSSGYGIYNLETQTFKIHGDILRDTI